MQRFRRGFAVVFAAGLGALILAASGGAGALRIGEDSRGNAAVDLTGVWQGNDGGTYYIRQVGSTVWWGGVSGDPDASTVGRRYSVVFRGLVKGSKLQGSWVDLPRGQTRRSGDLTLSIEQGTPLTLRRKSGGGSTTTWRKMS